MAGIRITFLVLAALAAQGFATPASSAQTIPVVTGETQQDASRRVELAARYAELLEFERFVVEMTQAISEGYIDSLVELGGGGEPSEVAVLREVMNETYAEVAPLIVERMVAVYAEVLSEEELGALVAFYESPLGASGLARAREAEQRIELETQSILPLFAERFRSRYCARVQCRKLTPTN